MKDFSDILFVLLGWLLGTLSPGIGRAILNRNRRKELQRALGVEFTELRFTLANALYLFRSARQDVDEPTIALIKPILLSYKGVDDRALVDSLRKVFAQPDVDAAKALNALPRKAATGPWPMTYELPLLENHVGEIATLPMAIQEPLMRVRTELGLYNEQVAYVRRSIDRTFEVDGTNHAINASNLEIGQANLATRTSILIRTLNRYLEISG